MSDEEATSDHHRPDVLIPFGYGLHGCQSLFPVLVDEDGVIEFTLGDGDTRNNLLLFLGNFGEEIDPGETIRIGSSLNRLGDSGLNRRPGLSGGSSARRVMTIFGRILPRYEWGLIIPVILGSYEVDLSLILEHWRTSSPWIQMEILDASK